MILLSVFSAMFMSLPIDLKDSRATVLEVLEYIRIYTIVEGKNARSKKIGSDITVLFDSEIRIDRALKLMKDAYKQNWDIIVPEFDSKENAVLKDYKMIVFSKKDSRNEIYFSGWKPTFKNNYRYLIEIKDY